MTDKSWKGLGGLVGGWGKSSAKPLPTSTRTCEAGHPMAIDWVKCPYCEAARNAGEKTRINDAEGSSANQYIDASMPPVRGPGTTRINMTSDVDAAAASHEHAPHPRRGTQVLPEAAAGGFAARAEPIKAAGNGGGRGATRVLDVGAASTPEAQHRPAAGRRLTGIVVTFTWSALGRLYEVHEGRNYAGSGTVSAEGHRDADILIADDTTMSSAHFLILCQGGKYRISDCNSTNGTFVNGELVNALGIDLEDNAHIQAGATLLVFKKVLPPSATNVVVDTGAGEQEPDAETWRPVRRDDDLV